MNDPQITHVSCFLIRGHLRDEDVRTSFVKVPRYARHYYRVQRTCHKVRLHRIERGCNENFALGARGSDYLKSAFTSPILHQVASTFDISKIFRSSCFLFAMTTSRGVVAMAPCKRPTRTPCSPEIIHSTAFTPNCVASNRSKA